jgi:hypothetical protein
VVKRQRPSRARKQTVGRKAPSPNRNRSAKRPSAARISRVDAHELDAIRAEVERLGRFGDSPRWNADPEDVRRSVAKLVLTLVEFIRQLLERQAIRRMDAGTLTAEEIEAVGLALMRLEETVRDIGQQFGLSPEDLNLDLGPIGRLK